MCLVEWTCTTRPISELDPFALLPLPLLCTAQPHTHRRTTPHRRLVGAVHRAVLSCTAPQTREHAEHTLECLRHAAARSSLEALTATLPATKSGTASLAALESVLEACAGIHRRATSSLLDSEAVSARSNAFMLLHHFVDVFQRQRPLRLCSTLHPCLLARTLSCTHAHVLLGWQRSARGRCSRWPTAAAGRGPPQRCLWTA